MKKENEKTQEPFAKPRMVSRRKFLYTATIAASATGILIAGCKKDDDTTPVPGAVDLGSGDTGILNYAYALEQLEAAFYTKVVSTPYSGISLYESNILNDIQKHEVAHREFLKAALGSAAIIDLAVDFSTIDFTSRSSVLATAKAFEDLGVSAYNGAGQLIASTDYLLIAGKIVSVEARHAAVIRDLLNPLSMDFAGSDVVNSDGLDMARSPSEVFAIAGMYVTTPLDISHLPTN